MRIGKGHSAGSQRIDIGSTRLGMPAQRANPIVQIVNRYKQYVGPLLRHHLEIPGVRNDMEVMESEAEPVAPRREIESRDRNEATLPRTGTKER